MGIEHEEAFNRIFYGLIRPADSMIEKRGSSRAWDNVAQSLEINDPAQIAVMERIIRNSPVYPELKSAPPRGIGFLRKAVGLLSGIHADTSDAVDSIADELNAMRLEADGDAAGFLGKVSKLVEYLRLYEEDSFRLNKYVGGALGHFSPLLEDTFTRYMSVLDKLSLSVAEKPDEPASIEACRAGFQEYWGLHDELLEILGDRSMFLVCCDKLGQKLGISYGKVLDFWEDISGLSSGSMSKTAGSDITDQMVPDSMIGKIIFNATVLPMICEEIRLSLKEIRWQVLEGKDTRLKQIVDCLPSDLKDISVARPVLHVATDGKGDTETF